MVDLIKKHLFRDKRYIIFDAYNKLVALNTKLQAVKPVDDIAKEIIKTQKAILFNDFLALGKTFDTLAPEPNYSDSMTYLDFTYTPTKVLTQEPIRGIRYNNISTRLNTIPFIKEDSNTLALEAAFKALPTSNLVLGVYHKIVKAAKARCVRVVTNYVTSLNTNTELLSEFILKTTNIYEMEYRLDIIKAIYILPPIIKDIGIKSYIIVKKYQYSEYVTFEELSELLTKLDLPHYNFILLKD